MATITIGSIYKIKNIHHTAEFKDPHFIVIGIDIAQNFVTMSNIKDEQCVRFHTENGVRLFYELIS